MKEYLVFCLLITLSMVVSCSGIKAESNCPEGTRYIEGKHVRRQCAPYGVPIDKLEKLEEEY